MRLLALLAWALLPGCRAVKGPGEVRGFLGGSLSVTCTYRSDQAKYPKFWCIPHPFKVFPCVEDLVITSESKHKGRFSIRDNSTGLEFTVTVDNLSEEDEGTFRCGVRTGIFSPDDSAAVRVIVYPAPSTLPSSTCTTTMFSDLTLSVAGHTQTVSQGETVQSTPNPSTPQVLNVFEHTLTRTLIVVLFLKVAVAGVLVTLSRKKKALSSADIEMDKTHSMSPTPLEDDREALHAKVQKPVARQEQIYANVPAAPGPREEL